MSRRSARTFHHRPRFRRSSKCCRFYSVIGFGSSAVGMSLSRLARTATCWRTGPLHTLRVFSGSVDGANVDWRSDVSGTRNMMVLVETAGNADGNVEAIGILSDTSIAEASFDAQPVPVDTSTCDVLLGMNPQPTRSLSHPTCVSAAVALRARIERRPCLALGHHRWPRRR